MEVNIVRNEARMIMRIDDDDDQSNAWFPSHIQKFTKWADKGTSINPFLPPRPTGGASKGGLGGKVITFLLGTVLCLIRLPFLLLALTLLVLAILTSNPFTSIILGAGKARGTSSHKDSD